MRDRNRDRDQEWLEAVSARDWIAASEVSRRALEFAASNAAKTRWASRRDMVRGLRE